MIDKWLATFLLLWKQADLCAWRFLRRCVYLRPGNVPTLWLVATSLRDQNAPCRNCGTNGNPETKSINDINMIASTKQNDIRLKCTHHPSHQTLTGLFSTCSLIFPSIWTLRIAQPNGDEDGTSLSRWLLWIATGIRVSTATPCVDVSCCYMCASECYRRQRMSQR